jgi:hypothetical protein
LFIVAVTLILLAWFVWPTAYRYDRVFMDGRDRAVRVSRFSGEGEILTEGEWHPEGPAPAVYPMPSRDEINASMEPADRPRRYDFGVAEGAEQRIAEVEAQRTTETPLQERLRLEQQYCAAENFRARTPGSLLYWVGIAIAPITLFCLVSYGIIRSRRGSPAPAVEEPGRQADDEDSPARQDVRHQGGRRANPFTRLFSRSPAVPQLNLNLNLVIAFGTGALLATLVCMFTLSGDRWHFEHVDPGTGIPVLIRIDRRTGQSEYFLPATGWRPVRNQ